MKKSKLTCLFISILMSISFASCSISIGVPPSNSETINNSTNSNNNTNNNNNIGSSVSFAEANVCNINNILVYDNISKANNYETPFENFTDGIYNYFYFRLGEIKNVPIYYSNLWSFNGIGEQTLSIENSQSVSYTMEQSTELCVNNTVNTSFTTSSSFSSALAIDDMTVSIFSKGFEESQESAYSLTTSTEYKTSIEQSVSNSTVRSLKLTKGDPSGDYRFIIYSDIVVYATLICELDTKTMTCKYMTTAKTGTTREGWFYGKTGDLMIERNIESESEKLTMSPTALENIDLFGKLPSKFQRRMISRSSNEQKIPYGYVYSLGPLDFSQIYNTYSLFECNKIEITYSFTAWENAVNSPKAHCYLSFYKLEKGTENYLHYYKATPGADKDNYITQTYTTNPIDFSQSQQIYLNIFNQNMSNIFVKDIVITISIYKN